MNDLLAGLQAGVAVCHVVVSDHGGLLFGLFITGLVGSLTHCLGMCGPLVLSQVASRMEAIPAAVMSERHRITGAMLLPYHLGRITTYTALGAVLSALAGQMVSGDGFRWVAVGCLSLAALFLLGLAIPRLKGMFGETTGSLQGWWAGRLSRWIAPLFAAPFGWRGYGLGVALGFIPCGLVYAALAAATAGGSVLTGAMAMACFAAGTVPVLIAVAVGGQFALSQWRAVLLQWSPLLLIFNALLLGFMAWQMLP